MAVDNAESRAELVLVADERDSVCVCQWRSARSLGPRSEHVSFSPASYLSYRITSHCVLLCLTYTCFMPASKICGGMAAAILTVKHTQCCMVPLGPHSPARCHKSWCDSWCDSALTVLPGVTSHGVTVGVTRPSQSC